MSTPVYFPDTDHINADGTMTIFRCSKCKERLRVKLYGVVGFRHIVADAKGYARTDCDDLPRGIPSRIAIPLESQ